MITICMAILRSCDDTRTGNHINAIATHFENPNCVAAEPCERIQYSIQSA